MAQQQKLATPPRTDLELIRKCAELVKDLGVTEHSELNVTFAFGQPQNGWKPWLLDEEQWPDLIEQGGTAISSAHLVLRTAAKNQPGFRVNWSRRPFPDPPSLDLTLSTPNDFPDPIKAARVTREKFEAYDGNYLLSHLDDESKAFIAEVKRHQAALREMSIKLGQDLVARRAELEEEFDLNRTKLEEAHSKRIEKLESEWAKKSEQHQQRVDEIEGLKARHSRRQLRDDLKTDLKSKQERFTLTNETNAKAQFVWIWLAILGVLAVCLIAVPMPWLADGLGTEVAPWYELGRRLLGGVGLALVGGYALQWQSQFYRRHAETEFRLQQLALDVDRAAWLVETAHDWKETMNEPVPQGLLQALSHGLFESGAASSSDDKPARQGDLAKFLMGAEKVRLNVAGNEFEFSTRSMKRAARTAGVGEPGA